MYLMYVVQYLCSMYPLLPSENCSVDTQHEHRRTKGDNDVFVIPIGVVTPGNIKNENE